ncbi:hypothetical protein RAB80_005590 [Fusarium oxysporum f. sp. vasinfectum]|uniref:Uncharacterized protein n=1 Tax=Fusarium oxysporum f. sp. vasinfectum 25433 TaxID=1089449 RepID=X0KJ34_FUSOX|nr:hypothetical protein FOTG_17909 [Fusarium oxysporum f. sp. vasinfectum 25433]KAK2676850.1 hypothetical protein RAB80_005590 [Fusarium oxysporum f. sp. vasinfectum]KAK2687128.1 hypothetical protein QWA68_014337 [Fusarium oxysporum]KAK2939763.1 hypothetical protein FoTM2_002983 [Fusarium oxysporum f. sp. vasinfectum]
MSTIAVSGGTGGLGRAIVDGLNAAGKSTTSQYSQAQLLASAIASDQALEAWAVSLPSSWAYQTFRNEPHHVSGSPWFA